MALKEDPNFWEKYIGSNFRLYANVLPDDPPVWPEADKDIWLVGPPETHTNWDGTRTKPVGVVGLYKLRSDIDCAHYDSLNEAKRCINLHGGDAWEDAEEEIKVVHGTENDEHPKYAVTMKPNANHRLYVDTLDDIMNRYQIYTQKPKTKIKVDPLPPIENLWPRDLLTGAALHPPNFKYLAPTVVPNWKVDTQFLDKYLNPPDQAPVTEW